MRAIALTLLLAASLIAGLTLPAPAQAPKYGGVLTIHPLTAPPSLSSHEESTIATVQQVSACYSSLVYFDPPKRQESLETVILELAEKWFARYGVLAIIFGRHIPGFRVPITVAAGVFKVRYPRFAASVAVSTAIWAGVVMAIGINFGPRMEAFLRLHREMFWLWAAVVIVTVVLVVLRRSPAPPTASLANIQEP